MKWKSLDFLTRFFLTLTALIFIQSFTVPLAFADDDDPALNLTTTYPNDGLSYQWSDAQYIPFYGDFNGDTIVDVVLQPKTSGDNYIYIQGVLINEKTVYTNGLVTTFNSELEGIDWSEVGLRLLVGDYNADGFSDILAFVRSYHDNTVAYLSFGTQLGLNLNSSVTITNQAQFPFIKNLSYYTLQIGDLNGDGASDVYAFTEKKKNAANEKLSHFLTVAQTTNSNYFNTAVDIDNKHAFRSKNIGQVYIQDFNGDQRADIFIQGKEKNDKHYYLVATEDGSYDFEHAIKFKAKTDGKYWDFNHYQLITVDINSDGFVDLLRLPKNSQNEPANNEYFYLTPETGEVGVAHDVANVARNKLNINNVKTTQQSENNINAPQNISYGDQDNFGDITVTWDEVDADVYLLEQQFNGKEWQSIYQGSINTYFNNNNAIGEYRFRVTACKITPYLQQRCSVYSEGKNTLSVAEYVQNAKSAQKLSVANLDTNTSNAVSIPSMPTGLTVNGSTSIKPYTNYTLTWNSPSGTGSGIYFTLIGEQSGVLENYITSTTSLARNKPPGTYYYRVRACNSAGCSAYSALSPAITVYGAPGVPTCTATPSSATAGASYTVSWGRASGVVHYYELVGEMSGTIFTGNVNNTYRSNSEGTYFYKTRACNDYKCNWQYSSKSAGITVITSNIAPVAVADAVSVNEDTSININVIANDSDANGDTISPVLASTPAHGSAVVNASYVLYTPSVNYNGNDSFSYYVRDTGGLTSSPVTVSITVNPVVEGTLAAPSISPNGGVFQDSASVSITAPGANIYYSLGGNYALYTGAVTITNNVTIRAYATKPDWNNSSLSTVNIGINHAPIISGTPASTVIVGQSYSFTPTASDTDGDTLNFSITHKPSWATFSPSTGSLTGTPNVVATDSNIVISVTDGSVSTPLPAFSITASTPTPQRQILFIHTDLLGSPVAETDQSGNVL